MNAIHTYIDRYCDWLREKTAIQKGETTDWFVIHTPFTGAFNDAIEIYVKKSGARLKLSDDGETLSNLALQGLPIQGSKKRRDLLDTLLLNYGIGIENNELTIETDIEGFAQSKHNLLSAIIEINDMYVLSEPHIASIFKEDVRNYLDAQNIIYTPDFTCTGSTGLRFNFDFQIAKKDREIVVKSFRTINRSNLPAFLFSWADIKPTRQRIAKKNLNAIAVINDEEKDVQFEFLEALKAKSANYILWSERNSEVNKGMLTAT